MRISTVRPQPFRLLFLLASALFLVGLPAVRADFFYWADTPIKTASLKTGYSFAGDALRAQKATNVKTFPIEVSGTVGKCYVAIHCTNTAPRVTAIVMVVGPDNAEVIKVRDAVKDYIAKIVNFD